MEPTGFHRKLTAILSADVADYSRLMQDDEAAAVKTLEAYKQIFSDLIKQHRGRVVDSPGDNLLAELALPAHLWATIWPCSNGMMSLFPIWS
jgi:adenylate cyclase